MKQTYCFLTLISQSLYFFAVTTTSEISAAGSNQPFIENKGQISDQNFLPRPDILYYGESGNLNYHFRKQGVSYQLWQVDSWKKDETQFTIPGEEAKLIPDKKIVYRIDMNWLNTSPELLIKQGEQLPVVTNYYLAVCPDGVNGIQSYKNITYNNIYWGIDLKWYHRNGTLEYDFTVSPGADYRQISWEIEGALSLFTNQNNELIIETPLGYIIEKAPIAFQGNQQIEVHWLLNDNVIGFEVGSYNPELPLIIDPVVREWCTFYGGASLDYSSHAAIDKNSNNYVVGYTESSDKIASTGSHQNTLNGSTDAMISKFDASGNLLWSTYYGGTEIDRANHCALDTSLNIYIVGITESSPVIATPGSHQEIFGGGDYDGFMVKFDNNGVRQWGTYFGGESFDNSLSIEIDQSKDLVISGHTGSTTGISTPGSYQQVYAGFGDSFIAKFDLNGNVKWSSYFGGEEEEHLSNYCTTDKNSNIYLCGGSKSTTGIATTGSFQTTYLGGFADGYLIKFDANGTRLWGTYFGGRNTDFGIYMVTDEENNVYVVGQTQSDTNIATPDSHQPKREGDNEGFLMKFDPNGTKIWGTYIGGKLFDKSSYCSIDKEFNIYVTGTTSSKSPSISTFGNYQSEYGGGVSDGYLIKFNSLGYRQWGTYFGDTSINSGTACLIDPQSIIYLIGNTGSSVSISTPGSYQEAYGGGRYDIFMARFQQVVGIDNTERLSYFDVYPNPTTGITTIDLGKEFDYLDVYLFRIDGQKILNRQYQNMNRISIDLSTQPTGAYLLKIISIDKTEIIKLLKL